jgi:cytoskeletal protein CcmA (bactofilin family)
MAKWGSQNLGGTTDDVSTLLSKDAEFQGTLRIQGSVRVDGTIKGDLVSTQTVTVGQTGAIEGNINAEEIIVAGKVKGTLVARGRVVLESSAQFEGDLTATKLAVVEGALFRGLSNMGTPKAPGGLRADAKVPEVKQERIAAA